MGFVPETFEREKFGVVFYVTILSVPAPVYEVIILKDKGISHGLLLSKVIDTSSTNC